jgi:hypothetical protein
MTRLLVSVRSGAEAQAALAGGAEIIDVKEPLRGALGAADASVLCEVRDVIGSALPLSAALGELLSDRAMPDLDDAVAFAQRIPPGYRFAKFGLAGCAKHRDWPQRWRVAMGALPRGVQPVAVAYADWRCAEAPQPDDVLQAAAEFGCTGLLLDTFDKQAGDVFHWLTDERLASLVASAQAAGMFVAVGGSLTLESAPRAIGAMADVIAVRGAACSGGRTGCVSAERVRSLAAIVKRCERNNCRFPQAG